MATVKELKELKEQHQDAVRRLERAMFNDVSFDLYKEIKKEVNELRFKIDAAEQDKIIEFGSSATLKSNDTDEIIKISITNVADVRNGTFFCTLNSTMAQAILGLTVDDEVKLLNQNYTIIAIE